MDLWAGESKDHLAMLMIIIMIIIIMIIIVIIMIIVMMILSLLDNVTAKYVPAGCIQ